MLFEVKWKNYDKDKKLYLSANFDNAWEIIDDFYKHYSTKLKAAN